MSSSCTKFTAMKPLYKSLLMGERRVMAIINITDDSFYESSRAMSAASIESRVEQAVSQGATIIDIGGYSSRPGAMDISPEQEWERVQRGLKAVRRVSPGVEISVDTFRSEIARRAIEEFGELIINDISAAEADPNILDVVARYDVPYVAMHMRGTPQTMQFFTDYPTGVVNEVCRYFQQMSDKMRTRGVRQLILDPGFGFAKSLEQNFELLAGLDRISRLGYPVLVGLSRKSMIYKTLDTTPHQALNGTTALHWQALLQGASILRVHDVREAMEVICLFERYEQATKQMG